MRNTRIDWCDMTWNPLSGCTKGCPYCYARKIATRFQRRGGCVLENEDGTPFGENQTTHIYTVLLSHGLGQLVELNRPAYFRNQTTGERFAAPYPCGFAPTFRRYMLREDLQRMGGYHSIFVGSMTDIFGNGIPKRWTEEILAACCANPHNRYILLTKHPENAVAFKKILSQGYFWIGTTITSQEDENRAQELVQLLPKFNLFLSIEPLLGPVRLSSEVLSRVWQVIIGAETGNRKEKVVPEAAWIEDIVNQCEGHDITVFMKDSLLPIMGDREFLRETRWCIYRP